MKHYGDVIAEQYLIEFEDHSDREEVEGKVKHLGGHAALEIAPNERFAIWNPDRREYSSQDHTEDVDA